MKIAVIGGGSTYSPELLHGLALKARMLGLEEVALFDTDRARLDIVGGFATRMAHKLAPGLRVTIAHDRAAAIEGARFVVVQIRVGGQQARLEDEKLGRAHGVIGQETTGVGGLAKALRTIPVLLDIAGTIESHAPHATLINFTNPVSIVTEALLNHARVQSIGLCNIPISQRMELAAQLRASPHEIELDCVGLNHLSLIRGVKLRGVEVLPQLIDEVSSLLSSGHKPANLPDLDFPAELISSLRMIPSDYLRYFFLATETIAEQRAKPALRAEEVAVIERELLDYYRDPLHDERPDALKKRGGAFYSHAALEIIEAIHLDQHARLVVDVKNGSAIRELPDNACVEVPAYVGARGAMPILQAPLEPQIRGLIQHVKAYEELAVRAAISRSPRDIYLAALAHPLTPSANVASSITRALAARLEWT